MKRISASTAQSKPLTQRQQLILAELKELYETRFHELDSLDIMATVFLRHYKNMVGASPERWLSYWQDSAVVIEALESWLWQERSQLTAAIDAKYQTPTNSSLVLSAFACFANLKDGLTSLRLDCVANFTSCSVGQVRKAIADLESDGLMETVSQGVYRVNVDQLRADPLER